MSSMDCNTARKKSADEIYHFWFGEMKTGLVDKKQSQRWFFADEKLDKEITEHFEPLLSKAAQGKYESWLSDARSCLALIILLDQFSRNIYRGSAKAFSFDALARDAVRQGRERGFDRELWPVEKGFFYMPLEHSEALTDQQLCVALFEGLLIDVADVHRQQVESSLQWAKEHCEIVELFGRFPHRNEVLGRESTQEEREYLRGGGKRFGQ